MSNTLPTSVSGAVGEGVAVAVKVDVGVLVGLPVGVAVAVKVGVGVLVGLPVGVADAAAVLVLVADGCAVADAATVLVPVADGWAVADAAAVLVLVAGCALVAVGVLVLLVATGIAGPCWVMIVVINIQRLPGGHDAALATPVASIPSSTVRAAQMMARILDIGRLLLSSRAWQ